ncbi:MAG: thioredoxin family protein [Gammaproteobacteria bacterium]
MLLETPDVKIGWGAQPFSLADPDGEVVTLDQLHDDKPFLIAFICNHCPYVKAIADRLASDMRVLQAAGIAVVAINSNDYTYVPADSPPNMKSFAAQHDFSFPYLVDETQAVARAYDAVCTPDFFGFNAARELQYRGRLDSAGMNNPADRVPELVEAMTNIAATGTGPTQQHPSIGCSIKWRDNA